MHRGTLGMILFLQILQNVTLDLVRPSSSIFWVLIPNPRSVFGYFEIFGCFWPFCLAKNDEKWAQIAKNEVFGVLTKI